MSKNTFYFQPTFGNRPEHIVGRDGEISLFCKGLREPIGSRERCILLLGQRGMGKTALLLEMADRGLDEGFVSARVTAHENMPSEIIEQIQLNGAKYFSEEKKRISGVNAGAFGFSFGLTFTEPAMKQYGFRSKLSLLCDRLAEKKKGILILVDEVHTSSAMREVAASYQELVGDGKNIAIVMAGLPYSISKVLNDKVLTFLNRASKSKLGPLSTEAIRAYFRFAFDNLELQIQDTLLDKAAKAAKGQPYLMQLIGYYLTSYAANSGCITKQILEQAILSSTSDLCDNVFEPTLAPLSDRDRDFLIAMTKCVMPVSTHDLKISLGKNAPSLQPYRKRLLEAGIIESPRRGELVFAVPYLEDYLRNQAI